MLLTISRSNALIIITNACLITRRHGTSATTNQVYVISMLSTQTSITKEDTIVPNGGGLKGAIHSWYEQICALKADPTTSDFGHY
jgi:hypothetical protein